MNTINDNIFISIKSGSKTLIHTKMGKITKDEFYEIKNNQIIPEKYINFILELFDIQNIDEIVTSIEIIYSENGQEKKIYCDKMLDYFNNETEEI